MESRLKSFENRLKLSDVKILYLSFYGVEQLEELKQSDYMKLDCNNDCFGFKLC